MKQLRLFRQSPLWLAVLSVGLILAALACNNDWRKTDRVVVLQEKTSPDGKYVATAFECEGGGAAGYFYANVNVRRAREPLNQRDFLLGSKNWSGFGDFDLQWLANDHLQVTYRGPKDPKWLKQNGSRREKCCGVKITYVSR